MNMNFTKLSFIRARENNNITLAFYNVSILKCSAFYSCRVSPTLTLVAICHITCSTGISIELTFVEDRGLVHSNEKHLKLQLTLGVIQLRRRAATSGRVRCGGQHWHMERLVQKKQSGGEE